jgi:catechol 2,3-dioxygenase-like lactoylglutathione lyase family enzyme
MTRLHVSVTVPDIDQAKTFYGAMFGAAPTVERPGYAKWMLDDPRVNFVATQGEGAGGVAHLGIQADDEQDLATLYERFETADKDVYEEGKTECCFAKSEKSWVKDPSGMAWEAFLTSEIIDHFGNGPVSAAAPEAVASLSQEDAQTEPRTGAGCC